MLAPRYDQAGHQYARTRRPDPRVAACIESALADATSIANVGAGRVRTNPRTLSRRGGAQCRDDRSAAVGLGTVLRARAENLPARHRLRRCHAGGAD